MTVADDSIEVLSADEQADVPIETIQWVKLARLALSEERISGDAELSLIFVDEPTIADLNERYLGETGPTDVLSFPLDDDLVLVGRYPDNGGRGPAVPSDDSEPPAIIGDVLICPAVARRQAEEKGVSLDDEIALLVVHGILHLLNYDHEDPEDEATMNARQEAILGKWGADSDE